MNQGPPRLNPFWEANAYARYVHLCDLQEVPRAAHGDELQAT